MITNSSDNSQSSISKNSIYKKNILNNLFNEEINEGSLSDSLGSIYPYELIQFDYIDIKYVEEYERNYESNNFVLELYHWFDKKLVQDTIKNYRIGSLPKWENSPIFWFIDINGNVCEGKIKIIKKLYETEGSLINNPNNKSVHSILQENGIINPEFNKKEIFFGEHLLVNNTKPVAIVESEKTAIISSMYFPEYIWLATGDNTEFNYARVKSLNGRDVTLCPNNDKFYMWFKTANHYQFKISLLRKDNLKKIGDFNNESLSNWIFDQIQIREYFEKNKSSSIED